MVDGDRETFARQNDVKVAQSIGRIEGILEGYEHAQEAIFRELKSINETMQQVGLIKKDINDHRDRLSAAESKVVLYQQHIPSILSMSRRLPLIEKKVTDIEGRDKKRVWVTTGFVAAIASAKYLYELLTKH